MIYLLDTNTVSDLINGVATVRKHFQDLYSQSESIGICQPVLYEVVRGLLWINSASKLAILNNQFMPLFEKWR